MKVYAGEDITITIPRPPAVQITDIGRLISSAVQLLLIVAGIIAFLYLLLGGIQWITSGGDKAGVDAARQKILHAIIGLIVVFATWSLITLLEKFLGVTIISGAITIPSPFGP